MIFGRLSWSIGAGILLIAPLLVGCNNSSADTPMARGRSNTRELPIGFIVSDLKLPWYATQIRAAEAKCKELNCRIIPKQARSEREVDTALNDIVVEDAVGVIVSAPDPMLGSRIVALTEKYRLRLMTIDVRFTDRNAAGEVKYLDQPFTGPDYRAIGNTMAQTLMDEAKKRGWNLNEVGVVNVRLGAQIEGVMRSKGAEEVLLEAGVPEGQFFTGEWPAPQSSENARSTAAAQFARGGGITKWLAFGYNDTAVAGIVRAAEARGITADNLIAVGATGFGIQKEFASPNPTGFFASVYVSPKKQAEQAVTVVHDWARNDVTADTMPMFQPGVVLTRETYRKQMTEDGLL